MLNEEFPYPYNEYYQMDKAEMVEVLFECLGYVMALLGVAPAREALPGEIIVDLQRHVTREYAICVLDVSDFPLCLLQQMLLAVIFI